MRISEEQFINDFKKNNPNTQLKRGSLMKLYDECRFMAFNDIDNHLMFMKRIAIITVSEYIDIIKMVKSLKDMN